MSSCEPVSQFHFFPPVLLYFRLRVTDKIKNLYSVLQIIQLINVFLTHLCQTVGCYYNQNVTLIHRSHDV